jgi:type IV pilus assembly protein PilM
MAKTRIALEITEEAVRAVEVTVGRSPVLVSAGEVALPPGAAKDSEIVDADAVAMALQRLWADAKLTSRDVVLGVGSRRILVREHTTQLTHPGLIRESLPFEVQDRLPVPIDQAVLDFLPTAHDADGVHGLLVAAVAENMEELVAALQKARLRVSAIDLVAFGHARALAALAPAGGTGLFVAIGEHTTHIVIATDGVPRFVRVVPIDIVAPPAEATDGAAAPTPAAVPSAAEPVRRPEPGPAPEPAPAPEPERERVPVAAGARFDALVSGQPAGHAASAPPRGPASSPAPGTRAARRALRAAAMTAATATAPAVEPRPESAPITPAVIEPSPEPAVRPLHPDVQAALIDLVGRVRTTLDFYRGRPDHTPIDTTFVSGVHADHPRLREALGRVAGTDVTPVTALDLVAPAARAAALPRPLAARLTSVAALLQGDGR